jgi:hypothetical protein
MWLDSRTNKPNSNRSDRYLVLFYYCGSIFEGIARWMPKDNYTDGDWIEVECTNGNDLSGEVLYYRNFPKNRPKSINL